MSKALKSIKNYYFPITQDSSVFRKPVTDKTVKRNLSYSIAPVQFERIRNDIKSWRDGATEAELPFYPHRVKMQRLFQDTILNGHVLSCLERRYDLTTLRDFKICDDKGNESPELKKYFRNITSSPAGQQINTAAWFDDFMKFALEAKPFGYTLITLGDIINDAFPDLSIIKRQNVSPDRLQVAPYVYSLSGENFLEEPYSDWHIWVPTPTDIGVSKCGYGLLYVIAYYEILLRNNVGYNADFIEVFGQPIRKGKTTKTNEDERGAFENALRTMGSSAYILLDDGQDEVELVESQNAGTGWQSYDNFEQRLEKKISKILLGHADALDSVPGKLGAGNGDDNPVTKALRDKQVKDGIFVQNIVNCKLIPLMRKHGFPIPLNYHFEFKNDGEQEEFRRREDESNLKTADIAVKMKNAGLQMDAKYFTERTGIPATPVVEPVPVDPKEELPVEEDVQ
jgi:hypothetical protein